MSFHHLDNMHAVRKYVLLMSAHPSIEHAQFYPDLLLKPRLLHTIRFHLDIYRSIQNWSYLFCNNQLHHESTPRCWQLQYHGLLLKLNVKDMSSVVW